MSFLVENTGGGEATAGLYTIQSRVSIIKEWYLQSGTGLKGASLGEVWGGGGSDGGYQGKNGGGGLALMDCLHICDAARL